MIFVEKFAYVKKMSYLCIRFWEKASVLSNFANIGRLAQLV